MNDVLSSSMKLFNSLFDVRVKTRKALNRAKEKKDQIQDEVWKFQGNITAATTKDPVLNTARIVASREQLEAWNAALSVAKQALDKAIEEVTRLESELFKLEEDLSCQMSLPKVKDAYREAVSLLTDGQKRKAMTGKELQAAECALSANMAELDRMKNVAVESETDEVRQVIAAIKAIQDEVLATELLVSTLRRKETLASNAVETAKEDLKKWESALWRKIAEDEFSSEELAYLRRRIIRAYTALAQAEPFTGPLYAFALKLFDLNNHDEKAITEERNELNKKHKIVALKSVLASSS